MTDYHDHQMHPIGPFPSSYDYILASIRLTLDLIRRGECYTEQAVDAFIIHRFLLDSASKILSFHRFDDGRFYLKHADDKGDHILIDDDHDITGIIDWEWAHTYPKSAAFNSPILLLPVADFYDGKNNLGDDELVFAQLLQDKGRADLAEIVKNGRILHRFEFCCGYDLADWDGFLGLFQGLRRALNVDEDLDWDAWKEKTLRHYKDDDQLKELAGARPV